MPGEGNAGGNHSLEEALEPLLKGIAEGVRGELDVTNEKVDKVGANLDAFRKEAGEDLASFRKEVNEKLDRPLLTTAASKRLVASFKRTLKGGGK